MTPEGRISEVRKTAIVRQRLVEKRLSQRQVETRFNGNGE
jgi:hypothetical protein